MDGIREEIDDVVVVCEGYASELFGGTDEERFTQITKWGDGDFRVLVWRGIETELEPHRHVAEKITYKHFDGGIYYAKIERQVDRHLNDVLESELLEEW